MARGQTGRHLPLTVVEHCWSGLHVWGPCLHSKPLSCGKSSAKTQPSRLTSVWGSHGKAWLRDGNSSWIEVSLWRSGKRIQSICRAVVACFCPAKVLRVCRSLVRSLEYFQSRGVMDFLGNSGSTPCQCFLNPSGYISGKSGLLHWPQVQVRGACCVSAVQPPVCLRAFQLWSGNTHNRLIA